MADADSQTVLQRLVEIQGGLKVPKAQTNAYGGYAYRSKEDILEAAKPLCHARGLALLCEDEAVCVQDGWVYVKCTASVVDVLDGSSASACGWAREPAERKGMDASQITGTASSYAGKRALGNLFALDDTADADQLGRVVGKEPPASGPFTARCRSCGTRYRFESREQYESFAARAACCPHPDWQVE